MTVIFLSSLRSQKSYTSAVSEDKEYVLEIKNNTTCYRHLYKLEDKESPLSVCYFGLIAVEILDSWLKLCNNAFGGCQFGQMSWHPLTPELSRLRCTSSIECYF